MQAARVVSGSLVTDIDMAGALGLLPLTLPPPRPPPISSVWVPRPPFPYSFTPIYFVLFFPVSFSSSLPHPRRVSFPCLLAASLSPYPRHSHPPPHPCLLAAGNCWLRQAKNGRCQVLYKTELSKEECCSTGRLSTSWTEEDVNDNTLFKWMIFNGGAPNCIPCKGRTVPQFAGPQ